MANVDLVLFDDATARSFQPFTLTRPAGEILLGALSARERCERVLGLECVGHLTSRYLADFDEDGAPPVLADTTGPGERDRLFLSSRAILAWRQAAPDYGEEQRMVSLAGEIVGCFVPAHEEPPPVDFFIRPTTRGPGDAPLHLEGRILEGVWDYVSLNADQLRADIPPLAAAAGYPTLEGGAVAVLGAAAAVYCADSATIEPAVVLDTRNGPILLDEGATVRAFTRLAGPALVGRDSVVLGGNCEAVTIGPVCKVRGEIESTIILGYSNKAHDGFIGHAMVGRWVNVGALTTNSDLKNNYSTVRIWTPGGETDTGEQKIGCFLGDHAKTGIGVMLNTGTVIGSGSNVFGAEQPPKYVPPFSWGSGPSMGEYRLDKFLETAELVMARRDVELTERRRELLAAAWRRGRGRS